VTGVRKALPPVADAVSLTIIEAAELLRVPVSAMRTLVRTHKIPSRRIGQEYRLSRAAVVRWLDEGDAR
jgi:excisionase family DNA binding protein